MSDHEGDGHGGGGPGHAHALAPAHVAVPRPVQGIRAPLAPDLSNNASQNWRVFRQKWRNYSVITRLQDQNEEYKVALLLHTLGDELLKIYNGFTFETDEDDRTEAEILQKFEEFAVGETNETYERFIFNKRDQHADESFESFLSAIRSLMKTCNYHQNSIDSILRDRIVLGIRDTESQKTLLKERNLTLARAIDIVKAAESANVQGKAFRNESSVNKVDSSPRKWKRKSHKKNHSDAGAKPEGTPMMHCKFCSQKHRMRKTECPAWGKTCKSCGQKNHFAAKCPRAKSVNAVETSSESDSSDGCEWINSVTSNPKSSADVRCRMLVSGKPVVFQVDTGAAVNILPIRYAVHCELKPTLRKLKMYNEEVVTPLGVARVVVTNPKNRKRYSVEFVVIKENLTPLLGLKAAEGMRLVTVNYSLMERIASVGITDKYADVFNGELGKLPGTVNLKVDESVDPVVSPARRIPIALKPKLKAELERLTKMGVIESVNEPTPWVNQMVIVEKKSGDLRICLDPRNLNQALKREHYQLPILEDTLHNMSESKVFTKLDVSSAYWHVELDEPSSLLTTFQTPFGRFRWRRLAFGLSASSEIFQKKILEAIDGLDGVECIADDVVVHGKSVEAHDRNLEAFLERCKEKGLKLNLDKLELRLPRITFMGHCITETGLELDPEKSRAVKEMKTPTNLEELRRFLGMANYLSRFIPNLNSVTSPLRNLLKKEVPFVWSQAQNDSFEKVRTLVSEAPVLAMYDPKKTLTLENDASEYGIGSVLIQEGRPVAYASRALSDTETRWAQIEKEMLAVVYGLEKFHHYTYGRDVDIITDHKPLVAIVTKPLFRAPKRLQALLLRTQKYCFSLEYKPGTQIPIADTLSRAPLPGKPDTELVTVNLINFSPIKTNRLDEIRAATALDKTLTLLKQIILKGWPNSKKGLPSEVLPYFHCRDEYTVQDGIVLRGDRVVIPKRMRAQLKDRIHAGHMGINACLRRARELIYWPGMSSEIRVLCESCGTCATYADKQAPETLFMHDIPDRPWQMVGTDLLSYKDRDYLVTSDYYSGFFELDFLPQTHSSTVITKLKHHFARHGIPDTLVSDGGPQYTSTEFKKFENQWGFDHDFSSPGNSKANGLAESAVKQAKRLLRKCRHRNEDPYLGLLNLRNTPTEGLNCSPNQRLFGRRTKTQIPTTAELLKPGSAPSLKSQIEKKQNRKIDTAVRMNANRHDLKPLQPGDAVRLQPIQRGDKEWKPATVTKQLKPRTYEVKTPDGKSLRRNRQQLRHKPHGECTTPAVGKSPNHSGQSVLNNENGQKSEMPLASKNKTVAPPTPVKPDSATDNSANADAPYVTRSGRVSRPPVRHDA